MRWRSLIPIRTRGRTGTAVEEYLEREVDLGEEVEGVVGEEGEQRVERRLRAPRRHPPHQIHRRLHANGSLLALFFFLPTTLLS